MNEDRFVEPIERVERRRAFALRVPSARKALWGRYARLKDRLSRSSRPPRIFIGYVHGYPAF